MIVRGFKSVIWVATVGGAALSCYMVSLQVATERAELTKVEGQIIAAKREIRSLQTELGTRGRLSQLEHWNAEVLALSAPSAAQYLTDGVKLARFERKDSTLEERSADLRMAALKTDDRAPAAATPRLVQTSAPAPAPASSLATPIVHRASFTPGAARLQPLVATAAQPVAAKAEPRERTKAPAIARAPVKSGQAKDAAKVESRPLVTAARSEPKPAAKASAEKPRPSRIDGALATQIKAGLAKGQGSGGN